MYYGIPFVYLSPPEKITIPTPTSTSLAVPTITNPVITISFPSKPSIPVPNLPSISSPILEKPIISWLPIEITIPDLEPIGIPDYIPIYTDIPDLSPPEKLTVPGQPSEIDYEKFKPSFLKYEEIYIPFFRQIPDFHQIEEFFKKEFNPYLEIPQNDLEEINFNLEAIVRQTSYYFPEVIFPSGNFLEITGREKLQYFKEEFAYLTELAREFIESAKSILTLSSFMDQIKSFLAVEKYSFQKFIAGKERELMLFSFISSVFSQRVRFREEFMIRKMNEIASNLRDLIIQNEAEYQLKRLESEFNSQLIAEKIRNITRESSVVEQVTAINRSLRELFRLYNQVFVIITTIEALNIERERAIVEKMIALARLEEMRKMEKVVQKEKEVLIERDKIFSERINLITAWIDRLTAILQSLQSRLEAEWQEVRARASTLEARGIRIEREAELAEVRANLEALETYINSYSRYIDTYLRVGREYIRTQYDILSYPLRLQEDIIRSAMDIYRASAFQDYYVQPIYSHYYYSCNMDKMCAHAMAQARLIAQITETFR